MTLEHIIHTCVTKLIPQLDANADGFVYTSH